MCRQLQLVRLFSLIALSQVADQRQGVHAFSGVVEQRSLPAQLDTPEILDVRVKSLHSRIRAGAEHWRGNTLALKFLEKLDCLCGVGVGVIHRRCIGVHGASLHRGQRQLAIAKNGEGRSFVESQGAQKRHDLHCEGELDKRIHKQSNSSQTEHTKTRLLRMTGRKKETTQSECNV